MKTEVKVLQAKMVEIGGKMVPCTVYSSPEVKVKPKMRLRGQQTHDMNLNTFRWSRGR